jgi:hypothetical protein
MRCGAQVHDAHVQGARSLESDRYLLTSLRRNQDDCGYGWQKAPVREGAKDQWGRSGTQQPLVRRYGRNGGRIRPPERTSGATPPPSHHWSVATDGTRPGYVSRSGPVATGTSSRTERGPVPSLGADQWCSSGTQPPPVLQTEKPRTWVRGHPIAVCGCLVPRDWRVLN